MTPPLPGTLHPSAPEPITPGSHPRLFLSGPMTGLPDWNFPAFRAQSRALRGQGFEVLCPSELFGGDQTQPYTAYMRLNLRHVTECDAVALLPGWMTSRGAGMETQVAEWLGLPWVNAHTLKPVSRCPCPACDAARAAMLPEVR